MILPIVAYGNPVLKKVSKEIDQDYLKLKELIANMWETMYNGRGVGLAAPQIGLPIRLFIVDSLQLINENEKNDDEEEKYKLKFGIKKVFINPTIIEEKGPAWQYEEGCLSIPDVRVKINRKEIVHIKYFDENFLEHIEIYDGMNARIIQHEYDHIQGILLTDHMTPLKRSLIKGKLENISKGKIDVKYKMKFSSGK
ncbi:MAG: peptide deformylase [Fimbriimonadaceae bacterium]|nr:peptide deformylase [Chitinophagales bacterium]